MPAVTEISLLPSATAGEIPRALREVGKAGIAMQGGWCAENAPWLVDDRGTALFQDLADPGHMIICAHWDSVEQHHACLATEANQVLLKQMFPLVVVDEIRPGHFDGVRMLPKAEDEGLVPALEAPVLVITTWAVPRVNKALFEEALSRVKGTWDAAIRPYVHRGGWKIEKDAGEDVEQFVVVGGLESVEKEKELKAGEAWSEYSRALAPYILGVDTKHYKRIL